MKGLNLERWFAFALSIFVSSAVNAFEWRLNDLWVCGDAPFTTCDDFPVLDPFIDDFDDGDRTAAPTATLVDFAGSNVYENGGYLVFDAGNGGIEVDLGGTTIPYIRDEVFIDIQIPDNTGDGFTAAAAQFDSDLSQLAVGGINDTSSGFGITFAGIYDPNVVVSPPPNAILGASGAQLGVFNSPISGCATVYFSDIQPGGLLTGFDVIDPACTGVPITGDIVLRLTLLQDTITNPALSGNNLLIPEYSIDGGLTYVNYFTWDSAAPAPNGLGSSFLIPISYDSTVITVFGQTAENQLSEFKVPLPFWALAIIATLLTVIAGVVRLRRI